MNTCGRHSKCSFIIKNSICPPRHATAATARVYILVFAFQIESVASRLRTLTCVGLHFHLFGEAADGRISNRCARRYEGGEITVLSRFFREWWRRRGAEEVSSSRSQRCCLSERTPSASRCPSRMFLSSCGASSPLPHVR